MIGYLEGKVVDLTPTGLYIDVSGVGYEVHISLNTYDVIQGKEQLKLYTHLQVREDAWTLYGFATLEEKDSFLKLISVSGVGASTARIMLSSITSRDLAVIIQNGDNKALEKIKGIGGKTAQRIILELKGKINFTAFDDTAQKGIRSHNTSTTDSLNALVGLGISKSMAETAIEKVKKNTAFDQLTTEEIIKEALKNL